eukprot:1682664-Rhodomonas_salina.2
MSASVSGPVEDVHTEHAQHPFMLSSQQQQQQQEQEQEQEHKQQEHKQQQDTHMHTKSSGRTGRGHVTRKQREPMTS